MKTEKIHEGNIDLLDQVRWWVSGGGAIHKNGHFDFNHYCNIIKIKNERIRYNSLDAGNTEIQTQTTNNDSSSLRH
jgi:hypothetical protein